MNTLFVQYMHTRVLHCQYISDTIVRRCVAVLHWKYSILYDILYVVESGAIQGGPGWQGFPLCTISFISIAKPDHINKCSTIAQLLVKPTFNPTGTTLMQTLIFFKLGKHQDSHYIHHVIIKLSHKMAASR